jgi:hypothetical protein
VGEVQAEAGSAASPAPRAAATHEEPAQSPLQMHPGLLPARARPQPGPPAQARQAEADSQPVTPRQPPEAAAHQRAEAPIAGPRGGTALQPAQAVQRTEAPVPKRLDAPSAMQQSIARIQEACQAPPLAPQEYRLLFEIMAKEINDNDLIGVQTLSNITQRAQERGIELRRDDVRFVLEVVSEADPWFEQGASADLFATRFRNFVVARCRGQGLALTNDELDLIDAWFAGPGLSQGGPARLAPPAPAPSAAAGAQAQPAPEERGGRWWSLDDGRSHNLELRGAGTGEGPGQGGSEGDEFPRIARGRLRG